MKRHFQLGFWRRSLDLSPHTVSRPDGLVRPTEDASVSVLKTPRCCTAPAESRQQSRSGRQRLPGDGYGWAHHSYWAAESMRSWERCASCACLSQPCGKDYGLAFNRWFRDGLLMAYAYRLDANECSKMPKKAQHSIKNFSLIRLSSKCQSFCTHSSRKQGRGYSFGNGCKIRS